MAHVSVQNHTPDAAALRELGRRSPWAARQSHPWSKRTGGVQGYAGTVMERTGDTVELTMRPLEDE